MNSQKFSGPIFLPGVLLEQAPFSMAIFLFFKKCYPWLFITTMPFLYFLLLHPEAKEKRGLNRESDHPMAHCRPQSCPTETSERFFYQEMSEGPIRVPQKRGSQGWLDVNVGKGAFCQA